MPNLVLKLELYRSRRRRISGSYDVRFSGKVLELVPIPGNFRLVCTIGETCLTYLNLG